MILGKRKYRWQNAEYVLGLFAKKVSAARKHYREFVKNGYDFNMAVERAAHLMGLKREEVLLPGKYKKVVEARSVVCYWAVRELGISQGVLLKNLASVSLQ